MDDDIERSDYVSCMKCQRSFHMDDCQPIGESGLGYVYCQKCYNEVKIYLTQIKAYAELIKDEYLDIKIRLALIDKNNNIIDILT